MRKVVLIFHKKITKFEIINKDHFIAQIDKDGLFKGEIMINYGRGYVPADEKPSGDYPTDTILIDSIYSPIRKVNYHVRKGESLSLIADKFNLSVKNIEKWNSQLIGKRYIQPGQRLVLYVDVIQAE